MFWQHGQLSDALREFTVSCGVEEKRDILRAGDLCVHHMAIVGRKSRAVLLEDTSSSDKVSNVS